MKVFCYDDITGDGAKHQLIGLLKVGGVAVSQTSIPAKWWQAVMVASSGVTRVGDSNVSSTNGIPIGTPNTAQSVQVFSQFPENYEVADIYVIIKSGDTFSFSRVI